MHNPMVYVFVHAVGPNKLTDCAPVRRAAYRSSSSTKLLWWDEVPPKLQFNRYIASGYRANLSYPKCMCSLFAIHNETCMTLLRLVIALNVNLCNCVLQFQSLRDMNGMFGCLSVLPSPRLLCRQCLASLWPGPDLDMRSDHHLVLHTPSQVCFYDGSTASDRVFALVYDVSPLHGASQAL